MNEDRNSRSGTYIEGIGDEVFHTASTIFAILIPITVYVIKYFRARNELIHPDNEETVNNARNHLGLNAERNGNVGEIPTAPPIDQAEVNNQRHYYSDNRCPICLLNANFPIETNCGHLFCAQCLIAYWRHGDWLGSILCPVCRQRVTLLMCNFNRSNVGPDNAHIMASIIEYNQRFSGEPRPILDYIRDIPALLRNLWREMFSLNGLVLMFRVRIIVCLFGVFVYILLPLDILPEAVLGILGFVDDLLVLLLVLIYFTVIYRNLVAAGH